MKEDKLLPIGSVVILKNATHRLMIIGYSPLKTEGELKLYDYWGCFYPEGFFQQEQTFIFNHDRISKVYSLGYSDDSEKTFRAKIIKIFDDVRDENGKLKMNEQELAEYIMRELVKGGNK